MSCCDENENCRQGRNCPNRKEMSFEDLKYKIIGVYYKLTEKCTLLEWLVCLATGIYLLSYVIR